MGILNGKDVFTSKYITAQIIDQSNHIHFVPIKYHINDYFITNIGKQLYVFKIDGSRIYHYKYTLRKSFSLLLYTTEHYLPITSKIKELEHVLKKNNLPKVNMQLLGLLKALSLKEGEAENFTPHDIARIISELKENPDLPTDPVFSDLLTFLESLSTDQIVTPLKNLSEFLDHDLNTADSKFLGSLIQSLNQVSFEHKKITNSPISGKQPWLKLIVILFGVMLIGSLGYISYEEGYFDSFSNPSNLIPGLQPTTSSSGNILNEYKNPQDLKLAVHEGRVDYDSLPKDVQDLLDSVELPQTIFAPIPESFVQPTEPEPTDKIEEPEPTDKIEEPEPTDKIEEPEPTDKIEEPEPTDKIEEPEPTDKIEKPESIDEIEEIEPILCEPGLITINNTCVLVTP